MTTASIVVPVFNSSEMVDELHSELHTAFSSVSGLEIILVNDGSQDESWNSIENALKNCPSCIGLCLRDNFGQAIATLVGIAKSKNDIIMTIDDDFQQHPKDLREMYNILANSPRFDAVLGSNRSKVDPLHRRFASLVISGIGQSSFRPSLRFSSLRAFRANVREGLIRGTLSNSSITQRIVSLTDKYLVFEFSKAERRSGKSGYSTATLLALGMENLRNIASQRFKSVLVRRPHPVERWNPKNLFDLVENQVPK